MAERTEEEPPAKKAQERLQKTLATIERIAEFHAKASASGSVSVELHFDALGLVARADIVEKNVIK